MPNGTRGTVNGRLTVRARVGPPLERAGRVWDVLREVPIFMDLLSQAGVVRF